MRQGFQFHAFATGFAGHITHPFSETIVSQAPSALSPAGGYSSSRTERFRFREIISFDAAYTQVSGAFSPRTNSWDTIMTATVENLDILGVIRADRIQARLASRHSSLIDTEPSILPLGSQIDGLQIAGVKVDVVLHNDLYSHLDTHSKVLEAYRDVPNFRKEFDRVNRISSEDQLPDSLRSYFPWSGMTSKEKIPTFHGRLVTTLVKELRHGSDFLPTYGHVMDVPQFGTVVLGQFLMDGNARRVTMLEVNFGSAVGGGCTGGSGETNGQPDPPPHDNGK